MTDIALRQVQVGIESTYGTPVAATRRWYGQGAIQQIGAEPTLHHEDRGSYDAYHRASQPVLDYEWSFNGGLDLDDLVEQLQLAINGATTSPTGVGPYVWTFTPGTALASMTYEWDSAGQVWEADGCRCDSFKLSGDANGDDVGLEMIGPAQAGRTTASLTSLSDHVTNVVQGWELQFYVDALGATPGTTEVPTTLIRWDIEIFNALQRQRRGDNSRYIASLARGRRMLTGTILAELNASTLTEITNQESVTERLIRLALGNNVDAGGGNYYLYIDVPCVLRTHTIEDDAELSVVSFDFTSLYDTTNAFAYEFTIQNARS